jgi:hypothetical protein
MLVAATTASLSQPTATPITLLNMPAVIVIADPPRPVQPSAAVIVVLAPITAISAASASDRA